MHAIDLVRLYPRLFHLAEDGSWSSIARHGLLSTKALLGRWGVQEPARSRLTSQVREEPRAIEHGSWGTAVIRDQRPIHRESLESALQDMTVEEWLDVLNSRVFFFLQPERLAGLLNARSYLGRAHTVITVDTASLLRVHGPQVELCRINSGFAQPHSKAPRGRTTFQSIEAYDHPPRAAARTSDFDVAELSVYGGVADIATHVIRVERMQGDEVLERVV